MNTSLPTPKSLKFLYFKYKDSTYFALSIATLTLIVSGILVLKVLLPQFDSWFSIRREVETTRQQLAVLNDNISFISSISDQTLDQNLQTVSDALPPQKSFTGILNAISDSAIKANIVLNDYTFNLGTIQTDKPTYGSTALSPIQISLVVQGRLVDVTAFMKQVEDKIPLAKVESMSFSHGSATIILTYFYKPFPNISFNDAAAIHSLPTSTSNLIKRLGTWRPTTTIDLGPAQQASYSADPFE